MSITEKCCVPFFSIGLTGGIGSGKSTVAQMFAARGAGVVDTDEIAHRLTTPDGVAMKVIRREFGEAFVGADGSLDRSKMRELVFQEPLARKKLENILHPLIKQRALDLAADIRSDYVIFVIPLLAEQPVWREMTRHILVVDCPEEMQVRRVMARSNMSRERVMSIMATQATREARKAIADDVILNDNGVERLLAEVIRLDATYKKIAEKAAFCRDLN